MLKGSINYFEHPIIILPAQFTILSFVNVNLIQRNNVIYGDMLY